MIIEARKTAENGFYVDNFMCETGKREESAAIEIRNRQPQV